MPRTVLAVVGFAGFVVGGPGQFPAFVLSVLLIATATFEIGLVVAAVAPNSRVTNAAGAVPFFPLMFLAGLWPPTRALLALAAYALVTGAVARRWSTWE